MGIFPFLTDLRFSHLQYHLVVYVLYLCHFVFVRLNLAQSPNSFVSVAKCSSVMVYLRTRLAFLSTNFALYKEAFATTASS